MATDPLHATYFQDLLRERDLSVTPFRVQLLKIFSNAHVPLSAQQLLDKFDEKVDKVTLYRNVEAFEKSGLICRMYFTGQEALYEERFSDHHHHHLICTNCGKIEDIDHCAVATPETDSGFRTDHHHVEFYGLCKDCQLLLADKK
jgi:Fe2+ or Zn2+ uptake regulation protein